MLHWFNLLNKNKFDVINTVFIPLSSLKGRDLDVFLKELLVNKGFIEVIQNGNCISFKNNIKDDRLESFQRRYGSGKISFIVHEDAYELKIKSNTRYNMLYFFVETTILTVFLTVLYIKSGKSNYLLYLLIGYVVLTVTMQFFKIRKSIRGKHKQDELLKLIEKELRIYNHVTENGV